MILSKFDQVIDDAIADGIVDPRDRNFVSLEATRFLHMTPDAGRPSDAARATVNQYRRLGRDAWIKQAEDAALGERRLSSLWSVAASAER